MRSTAPRVLAGKISGLQRSAQDCDLTANNLIEIECDNQKDKGVRPCCDSDRISQAWGMRGRVGGPSARPCSTAPSGGTTATTSGSYRDQISSLQTRRKTDCFAPCSHNALARRSCALDPAHRVRLRCLQICRTAPPPDLIRRCSNADSLLPRRLHRGGDRRSPNSTCAAQGHSQPSMRASCPLDSPCAICPRCHDARCRLTIPVMRDRDALPHLASVDRHRTSRRWRPSAPCLNRHVKLVSYLPIRTVEKIDRLLVAGASATHLDRSTRTASYSAYKRFKTCTSLRSNGIRLESLRRGILDCMNASLCLKPPVQTSCAHCSTLLLNLEDL